MNDETQRQNNGSALDRHTLILASSFQPLQVIPTRQAVELLYRGAAKVVGSEEVINDEQPVISLYQPFNWTEWATVSRAINGGCGDLSHIGFIHGVNGFCILRPSVLHLRHFHGWPHRYVHLTRRNIHIRDDFTCQYCGARPGSQYLNVDHIVPMAKGGKTRWENLVSSCYTCNNRKEDRPLKEAGLHLKKRPKPLHWFKLMQYCLQVARNRYPDWQPFLQQYVDLGE
ncbi:MAG: hypothetical protein DRJ03_18605 [Chloroflexi bacterium]|nr:MAG: hypothetical protein DRJ03_18605 [Chloroflexota bacterium]